MQLHVSELMHRLQPLEYMRKDTFPSSGRVSVAQMKDKACPGES
jgi:hypothetical protein